MHGYCTGIDPNCGRQKFVFRTFFFLVGSSVLFDSSRDGVACESVSHVQRAAAAASDMYVQGDLSGLIPSCIDFDMACPSVSPILLGRRWHGKWVNWRNSRIKVTSMKSSPKPTWSTCITSCATWDFLVQVNCVQPCKVTLFITVQQPQPQSH